jgi:hypothetical protein
MTLTEGGELISMEQVVKMMRSDTWKIVSGAQRLPTRTSESRDTKLVLSRTVRIRIDDDRLVLTTDLGKVRLAASRHVFGRVGRDVIEIGRIIRVPEKPNARMSDNSPGTVHIIRKIAIFRRLTT